MVVRDNFGMMGGGTARFFDKNQLERRGVWVLWGKTRLESAGPRRSVSGCNGVNVMWNHPEPVKWPELQPSGLRQLCRGGLSPGAEPPGRKLLSSQHRVGGGGEHRGNFGSSMGASHQMWGGLQAESAMQQSSSKVGGSGLSSAKEAGEKWPELTNKSTRKFPWGIPQIPEEAWKGFFIGWNWEKRGKMFKK